MQWLQRLNHGAVRAFAVGIALTGIAALWQARDNATLAQLRFDAMATRAADQVESRTRIYQYGLRGARGAVLASGPDGIDRARFHLYSRTRDLASEFPGARGFGVIRRVAREDEARFVAAARRDGAPEFSIKEFRPSSSDDRRDRYVIQYIEPADKNREAIGYDIASDDTRRSAAETAMRSGSATLTGPITLAQAQDRPLRSLLLLLPIYRTGATPTTTEERVQATVGWTYAPLVMDEVLQGFDYQDNQFALIVRDVTDADACTLFTSPGSEAPPTAGLLRQVRIKHFGREWEAEVRARPRFVESLGQRTPLEVGMVGTAVAALLCLLLHIQTQSSQRATQVQFEQSRRAAILVASSDAIVSTTLDGVITDWNHAAEQMFGYSAEQVIGQALEHLLLPDDRRGEDSEIRAAIAHGEPVHPFETVRKNERGALLDVSCAASPIVGHDGRVIGIAKTLRDISAAKNAQKRIRELNATLERQVAERTASLDSALHDLRTIINAVPAMIGYWDKNLLNRVANQAYSSWFGVEPDSIRGRHMQALLGEELFEKNRPFVAGALRGEAQTFERSLTNPKTLQTRHSLANYLPDIVNGEVRGFYVLISDVTDVVNGRLRLAAAQRESEALLSTFRMQAIFSVADRAGRIIDVNENFCRIAGYERAELLGQNHRIVNSGVQDRSFWTEMWRKISAGESWRSEVCNRAKDGSLYWVDSIIAPFIGADGRIEKYISIRIDITAAKRAAEKLRASEAFLDRAGRVAGVGGWELDLRSNALTWSAQTYRIHEVESEYQPALEEPLHFFPPEARPTMERAVADGMAHGTGWDLELPFVTARGRQIWVRSVGVAELDDGTPVRLVGAIQDITARKQAELELTYERHLMTSLLNTLPDQIYFKDLHSRFLRINPGLARRYGLRDASEAVGKSDADFFTAEHAGRTAATEQQIILSGEPVLNFEEKELWPDRPPTWNLSTKMPLHDAQGRVIGTFGISRDITTRKQIEDELQRTNERFAIASAAANIGVWEFDVNSNTLAWDDWMYRLYGLTRTTGTEPYDLWLRSLHPEDRTRFERKVQATLWSELPLDAEFRIVRPDGDIRHMKVAARVTRDADGKPERMTGVNLDITTRKRAELELFSTSSLLHTVLESASEISIIATDPQLNITVFNAGARRLLGYDGTEVIGRLTPLFMHDLDEVYARSQELASQLGRPIAGAAVLTDPSTLQQAREWNYVRKDGRRVVVSLVVTAMRTDDGDLFGYLCVAHDVTRQKQYEESLRDTMHKAEQANLAKSQFLANVSHEIRTPMNAVIGLTHLLGQTALNPQQSVFLAKINLASKSLLGVINDVLDLSKIEAGELMVEQADFNLPRLLKDLGDVMSVQADTKKIDFEIDVPPDLPVALRGDVTRLKQILTNLLANAIKFTDHGGVLLQVQQTSASSQSVRLRFGVQDSGIGIAPEVQARLFAPFAQADVSTTRRFGGTGLGLSIVKHLTSLLGGEVSLTSTPGIGSEFAVVLDFPLASPESESQLEAADYRSGQRGLADVRVLVVDDSEINLDVAKRILELEGAVVTLACNGKEAFDLLQMSAEDFDVVLMDVQMPVLDGHEATRKIREELKLTQLPIIALTAGALTSERQRAIAAGMDDFVTKPFDVKGLAGAIRRHVKTTHEPLNLSHAPRAATEVQEVTESEEFKASKDATAATAMALALPWPAIAGIDSSDARLRLGGDLTLFHSLLKRLLGEFADLPMPPSASDAAALKDYAARMHKLRGSAGNLGAKELHRLAGEAEAACRAGRRELAEELVKSVARQLRRLSRSAATALASADAPALPAALPDNAVVDPKIVSELLELLRQQSLTAVDRFTALSPQLQRLLSKESFAHVRDLIDNLQFTDAADALESQG